MTWRFNPMSAGELNVDPIEHEFFATETLTGITDALVREAIQNSLDAAAEGADKVRVRFSLREADGAIRERYLATLWPNVETVFKEGGGLPGPEDAFRFLTVEDEGTRGLEGDPRQYEDVESVEDRNDFYYFWRNIGRSRKETTERGRWGLGKTVFAAASRLHAYFGLTIRRHHRPYGLLMGQAVLKIHRIGSQRYRPYGYYGRHENDFPLPLDHTGAIKQFIDSFRLHRQGTGLSIVIPYPDEEITKDGLLESTLRHYFHPLLEGKLEVEINETGDSPIVLRTDGLEREIRRRANFRSLLSLIELARWGLNPEQEAVATVAAPATGRAPKLTEDLFDGEDIKRMRQRYDDGRRLALDVRLPIKRATDDTASETKFVLLLERDAHDSRGQGDFVRQGITIENPKARRPRGVRWIVLINDPTLSAFLGDAENPAHTEWQRSSPKFKAKYDLGPSTLDFLRSTPDKVASILSRPAERRDPDLLREIFSLSKDAAVPTLHAQEPTPRDGDEESTVEPSIPAVLGKNGSVVLGKVRTGFRLRGRVDAEGPRRLEVVTAYDVLRGNAFRRYSPLDFSMDKWIAVQAEGARIVARQDNRLELEIDAPVFEVLVTRFDENRDLRVKVHPLEDAS